LSKSGAKTCTDGKVAREAGSGSLKRISSWPVAHLLRRAGPPSRRTSDPGERRLYLECFSMKSIAMAQPCLDAFAARQQPRQSTD